MNVERIDLALVLSALGVPLNLDSFNKRLTVQKKVYLTQLMGVDLGFRFGWYLRGPYSTGLTETAFALIDDISTGDREFDKYSLHTETARKVKKANTLCTPPDNFQGSDEDWIELLASLHYLRHIAYRPKNAIRDFDDTFQELIETKPRFTNLKAQARQAWARLDEFQLIAKRTLA